MEISSNPSWCIEIGDVVEMPAGLTRCGDDIIDFTGISPMNIVKVRTQSIASLKSRVCYSLHLSTAIEGSNGISLGEYCTEILSRHLQFYVGIP